MSPARTPDASAAGRLQRLLALVPWVLDHPGATVDEVCERFDMTRETLIADLELLYVTGVPPYGPGDLMEAWVDGDKVHIGFADWFARAPRLTWREAAGLYLAGRALDALPEVAEQGALARALAKLEAVLPADQLGRVHELAGKVSVDLEGDPAETSARTELARAAAAGHRVEIEYWSSSRGELTRRKVDPWLVFSASGHWYLSGWCHKAVGERLFRVDRVVSVRPTAEPFERPAGFDPAAHGELGGVELFAGGLECELDLAPEAEWAADYFPILGSERRPDGRLRVRLATHQLSWLVRLVLRLAPAAEPVSPPELRNAVAEATRNAPRRLRLLVRLKPAGVGADTPRHEPRFHAADQDPRHLPGVRRGRADPARRGASGLQGRGAQLLRLRLPGVLPDRHQAGRPAGGAAADLRRGAGPALGPALGGPGAAHRPQADLGRPARPAPGAGVARLVGAVPGGVPLRRPTR